MRVVITGGAGFIGSNLLRFIVRNQLFEETVVIDDLSSGDINGISEFLNGKRVSFIRQDLTVVGDWMYVRPNMIFHYAAESDVKGSYHKPREFMYRNITSTINVMEMARKSDAELVIFSSSSTVYGDPKYIPVPEDHPLNPISVYGWSKLTSEQVIHAYSKTYGIPSLILRLANVVGPNSRKGVVIDFIRKLRENPMRLRILGDGNQRKSYIHVSDVIRANLHLTSIFRGRSGLHVFNVGSEDWIRVKDIAAIVLEEMGLTGTALEYEDAGDGRGWVGDVKTILLSIDKIKETGWAPTMGSAEAVRLAVRENL